MNYVWWAVRDQPVDELIAAVLTPEGLVRDPRFYDDTSLDEDVVLCLVLRSGWTVVVVPEGDDNELAPILQVRGRDVVHAYRDDDNQWSTLNGYRDGVECWTVYGAAEDDYMRIGGTGPLPPALDDLSDATDSCDEVVLDMSRALLGFAIVDDDIEGEILRTIAFRRESPKLELQEADPLEIEVDMDDAPAPGIRAGTVHGELDMADVVGLSADRVLVRTFEEQLFSIDTGRLPPSFYMVTELKGSAAVITPWGTTLVAATDDETSNSLLVELGAAPIPLPFDVVGALFTVGTFVIAFPAAWATGHPVPQLISLGPAGERIVTPIAVPPGRGSSTQVGDVPDPAVAAFGDGSFALSWMGQPYRWHAGHVAPFPAAHDLQPATAVTLRDGTVLANSGGQLVRLTANGDRSQIAGLDDVRFVVPGKDDSVIVSDGDVDTAFVIVWPGARSLTRVSWTALTSDDETSLVYYDPRLDALLWIGTELRAIEWRALAALPRR